MGQKFAAYNAAGAITGFYDSVDSPVPEGSSDFIAITDDEWQDCLSTPGYRIADGVLVAPVAPSVAQLLAAAQAAQIASLTAAYQAEIQRPVTFTSKSGATKAYQADAGAIANLQAMLVAFQGNQDVPAGFYWVASDNSQVPFTYADMQAIALVIGTRAAAAFQQLQVLKATVGSASTIDAAQAVVWP